MTKDEEAEIDRFVVMAKTHPDMLVQRMKGDAAFLGRVNERLKRYARMEQVGRIKGCWLSRRAHKTLRAALDTLNKGVP